MISDEVGDALQQVALRLIQRAKRPLLACDHVVVGGVDDAYVCSCTDAHDLVLCGPCMADHVRAHDAPVCSLCGDPAEHGKTGHPMGAASSAPWIVESITARRAVPALRMVLLLCDDCDATLTARTR